MQDAMELVEEKVKSVKANIVAGEVRENKAVEEMKNILFISQQLATVGKN